MIKFISRYWKATAAFIGGGIGALVASHYFDNDPKVMLFLTAISAFLATLIAPKNAEK